VGKPKDLFSSWRGKGGGRSLLYVKKDGKKGRACPQFQRGKKAGRAMGGGEKAASAKKRRRKGEGKKKRGPTL